MNLLEIPTEILLLILERMVKLDPITLLGSVPGVCKRMRALCPGVHGTFDLRGEFEWMNWDVIQGALTSAALHFPWTRGLWTFSRFPLHHSCMTGMSSVAKRLLNEDRSRVDEKDRMGATPLFISCHMGHLEIVQVLLDKGADADKARNDGRIPLYMACLKGHVEVVRLLVEKGADVDKAKGDGWTPLFMACLFGRLEVVRLLLENGADMNKADNDGFTPLSIARNRGHVEIVALLEQAGAW